MTRNLAPLASALLLSLLAAPAAVATDLTGGVANVAPTLTSVNLSSSSLTPTAGTTTSFTATIVAADLNGFADIGSGVTNAVTVGILKPDGSTVQVAQSAATFVSGSGISATYTKTLTMNYYDAAALTTSTYKVKVVVTDAQSATVNNLLSLATFNYAQLAALNAPSSVDTGSNVAPGDSGSIATMAVGNYGNVQIDAQVSGTTPASSSNTIPIGSIKYSLSSNMASSTALTGSGVTMSSFDLASGSGSSKNAYWQMTMPSGSSQYVPSGTYT
ncbi:MAG: hypothetical protein ABR562_09255, partial [Thermoplasmatota archaeon]